MSLPLRFPRLVGALALLAAVWAAVAAGAAPLALVGARLYVQPGSAIEDAVVLIDADRIVAAGPRAVVAIPRDARIVDCAGNAITAGFWNSHVHLITAPLLAAARKDDATLQAELDAMLNRWGFTTVFDLASPLANTQVIRGRIEHGELRGPRVLTVGEPLWTRVPVYVSAYLAANGIPMPVVHDAAEARERVEQLAAAGVDGIKLFTGSVQVGSVENMPKEIAVEATRAAHRHGLPVFSHAQNEAGFDVALAAGVDVIAHALAEGGPPGPRATRMAKSNTALIPTLTLFERQGFAGAMDVPIAQVRAQDAAGGELLFGTDVGYIEQYDTRREFELLARALSFDKILAMLTTTPARRFGRGQRSGRVVAGEPADLVVLRVDPADDVTALARVRLTIRGGKITYGTPDR